MSFSPGNRLDDESSERLRNLVPTMQHIGMEESLRSIFQETGPGSSADSILATQASFLIISVIHITGDPTCSRSLSLSGSSTSVIMETLPSGLQRPEYRCLYTYTGVGEELLRLPSCNTPSIPNGSGSVFEKKHRKTNSQLPAAVRRLRTLLNNAL